MILLIRLILRPLVLGCDHGGCRAGLCFVSVLFSVQAHQGSHAGTRAECQSRSAHLHYFHTCPLFSSGLYLRSLLMPSDRQFFRCPAVAEPVDSLCSPLVVTDLSLTLALTTRLLALSSPTLLLLLFTLVFCFCQINSAKWHLDSALFSVKPHHNTLQCS